jgi:hypothetical protein
MPSSVDEGVLDVVAGAGRLAGVAVAGRGSPSGLSCSFSAASSVAAWADIVIMWLGLRADFKVSWGFHTAEAGT